jgi:hypothetical protein
MPRKISTGKYLKASQLTEAGSVHTIISCEEEAIQSQTDADGELIAACGTDDVDEWAGKKIIVYNDPSISYGGSVTGGCRIRAVKAPKRASKRGQAKAAPVEDQDLSEDIPF